jgi:alkyl hydroperoxide reductase subunit AhpF
MDQVNRLELYIMRDCVACRSAKHMATRVARLFPELDVLVIDLDAPQREIPATIFAAPTFRLNGRVISLGTPDWETLTDKIKNGMRR